MAAGRRGPVVVAASLAATPTGLVGPSRIVIDGGRIAAVEAMPAGTRPPSRVVVPGFVDLQVNGIDDIDVAAADGTDWERLDRLLLAQGVTTWCPTLVSAPLASYAEVLARIAAAAARAPSGRPAIAGAHLEGPFLGRLPGAHAPQHVVAPDPAWLAALPPIVRLVTLGPEVAGAASVVAGLVARGVVVALGHSDATYEEAEAAAGAGASLVTHLFNAMGALHHRRPGLAGAALADDRLVVSVIADLVHLHPAVLASVFRAKGAERVALVTDSVGWRRGALGPAPVTLADGAPRLADGTLAGSVLTMDQAVRNAVASGVALASAVTAAATTPATVLGLSDRGAIVPGRRADLVALSPVLSVEQVWIAGESAWPVGAADAGRSGGGPLFPARR